MRTSPMSHDINPAVVRLTRDGPLLSLDTREPLEPGPYGAGVVPPQPRRGFVCGAIAATQERSDSGAQSNLGEDVGASRGSRPTRHLS